jgi:hypothetical protein
MRKLLLSIAMIIFIQNYAVAGDRSQNTTVKDHSLGFITPYDWADFTDKEKELYVSGVVDGEIFMLYGASSPELDSFLKCVKKEGIKSIIRFTELQLGLGSDIDNPMPWAISEGVGMACKKYRKK